MPDADGRHERVTDCIERVRHFFEPVCDWSGDGPILQERGDLQIKRFRERVDLWTEDFLETLEETGRLTTI